jgi:hypothetical protein
MRIISTSCASGLDGWERARLCDPLEILLAQILNEAPTQGWPVAVTAQAATLVGSDGQAGASTPE